MMLPRIYRTEADIRKHQINTLKVFNANVTEITEGIEYKVGFNAGGKDFFLQVSLGKDFPIEKPLLKVLPSVIHPWVNTEGDIVSAPGLLNFTVHSDLGRVVQAIIREFERTPPPLASEHCGSTSPSVPNDIEKTSPNFLFNFSPPSHSTILNTNFAQQRLLAFPELAKMTVEQLKLLNENVDMQEDLIFDVPEVKEQNRVLEELMNQVEELAVSNLSKKEKLDEVKSDIESKIEKVSKLVFENERLHVVHQNLCEKYSPRNIQDHIRQSSKKADEESEKVAESFLNAELDVEKFVSLYINNRKLYHMRRTKEEKLSQQLHSLDRAGF